MPEPLPPTPREPRLSRPLVIVGLYGALALAAWMWSHAAGRPLFRLAGAQPAQSPGGIASGLLSGLALGLLVVAASRWSATRFAWARVLHEEFHALVHDLKPQEVLVLAVASAIGEELFFRGAMLQSWGLVPSTLVFAALHFRPHARFLPWTVMSLIVGLMFGILFVELGDLTAPLVAHFTINWLNLGHIARSREPT